MFRFSRKTIGFPIAAAIALAPLSVLAAEDMYFDNSSYVYFGGKGGWNQYTDACSYNVRSCKEEDFAWGLFGGYTAESGWGIEAGYLDLGKAKAKDGTTDVKMTGHVTAWELSGTYKKPFTPQWSWMAKIGAAFWEDRITSAQRSNRDKGTGASLLGGLGIEYRLTDRWTSRFEYDYIDGDGINFMKDTDTHSLFLALHYRWPLTKKVAKAEEPKPEPKPKPKPKPEPKPDPEGDLLLRITKFQTGASAPNRDEELRRTVNTIAASDPSQKVYVIGHTDSQGSDAFNQKLSEKRAMEVKQLLVDRGVDANRITVEGRGETQPIASNETAAGRAENRRVEVRLMGKE